MKNVRVGRVLLLFLSLLWLPQFSPANSREEESGENSVAPLMDLLQIYKNIEDRIPLSPFKASDVPLIKKDGDGGVWTAWEEWGVDRSQIRISRVQEGRIVSFQTIGKQKGFNFSPDFAFDQSHLPWVIWVNGFNQDCRIIVQEISSQRTWTINSGSSSAFINPRIIFDRENIAWALWNESDGKSGEIFYRVFDRGEWSPRKIVPQENTFPPLNPDAAVDGHGLLWVTWSRYDGEDYEIYLSAWNGQAWSKEVKITDNRENDTFPSIGLGPNNIPVISWTQTSWQGNQICVKYLEGILPSQEIKISQPAEGAAISRIVREGEKTGIIWKSVSGIKIKEFSLGQPEEKASFLSRPVTSQIINNPSFDENKYVGLGDSITYGYLNRLPAPELGYIPRLDAILDQNFGPSQVINEGVGGDTTVGGLSRIDRVISTHAARYILIMEGTNDVITGGLSMDTSVFNLSEMIRKCLEAGVFPVIATIIPRRDWLWDFPPVRERHLYLVEKIRQIAAEFPVPLVDQYSIFYDYPSSDGGLLFLLSNDLLHPSEKGYEVMAEAWFGEIKNFPFPPVNIQLTERSTDGDFSYSLRNGTSSRPPKKPFLSSSKPNGNLLTWMDNPKIFDKTKIWAYKIYRKRRNFPEGRFRFLAVVRDPLRFLDRGAHALDEYIYVISTLREDGVEGPCSEPTDK